MWVKVGIYHNRGGLSYLNQFGSMVDVTPPPAEIDYPARFRLRVTWAYVANAPGKAERNVTIEAPPAPVPVLVAQNTRPNFLQKAPQDAPVPPQTEVLTQEVIPINVPSKPVLAAAADVAKAQWEMVIPKMARPWPKRG